MAKGILRRVLAILLAVSLAAAYLPAGEARAATALTTNVPGLTASYENGTWSANGTALSGSATGSAGGGCESASATTSTLTLKNGKGTEAILAFDYDKPVLGSGGSVTIAGTAVTAAGTFTKTLSADEAVTVVIVSGNAGAYTSSVDLKNVTLVSNVTVTTTFAPPTEGGSYTVDGTAVTEQTSYTQPAAHAYALAAAPAAGFKFLGWYSVGEDKYLSASAAWNAMFDAEKTIRAEFVSADTPVFETNGKWFTDLRDAASYAASAGASKITLIADGTLPAGEYTVPAGISLLIPYDSAHTLKTTVPDLFKAVGPTAPWKYKTLTMASGASLTVKGRLNVGGKVNSTNNGYTGVTSGPYGFIDMKEGSSITVEQDAYLYCWGYISGAGTVHVLSGGTVYEPFQICDIRGGTATNSMNGNDQKVFPVSQYYVQNIEAGMTLEYGAKEIATGSATVQGMTENPQVSFIGTSGSMFNLSSGGRFVKTYDPKADRVTYDIFGDARLDSIKMNVGISVNSADYVLPIMENTSIRIRSGNTVINQDLCLIPGFEAEIGQGAAFAIASGKNLYVYDRDEWQLGKFIYPDTTFKTSYYSPSRANADKFTDAKMVDVKLDVNGTVEAAGGFYATAGGAEITSSAGTGKVIMSKVPSDGMTYQATQSGTTISYTSIPVTSAKLHNGSAYAGTDEEYTLTAGVEAGKTYLYSKAQDR